MIVPCLLLILVGLIVSLPTAAFMRSFGRRVGALDGPGVAGQLKAAPRRVPNTGGVAIYLGITLPIMLGLLIAGWPALAEIAANAFPAVREHLAGLRHETTHALILLTGLTALHIIGVIDDRKPLGPWVKLAIMLGVGLLVVIGTDSRLLTLLDVHAGSPWLSIVLTVLWLGVVTNAFNFMDNMDGLSAGVGVVAAACFLAGALIHRQWFIAACLALLIGALLGFLFFNFPRRADGGATLFMGDGGSLVLGFMLAFLTVRTTYIQHLAGAISLPGDAKPETFSTPWYGVLMPLVVLAVPLYDFLSVSAIRLSQGRSPFVGDLQHLSHRLVRRGLSKRDAVLVIYGLTAITALGGIVIGAMSPWQAAVVAGQTLLVLFVLAVYEGRASGGTHGKQP